MTTKSKILVVLIAIVSVLIFLTCVSCATPPDVPPPTPDRTPECQQCWNQLKLDHPITSWSGNLESRKTREEIAEFDLAAKNCQQICKGGMDDR